MLGGGMVPVCTLRTTFSQTSAAAPGLETSIRSNLRSAVLSRSLWHVTQYRSSRRRGLGAGVAAPAAELDGGLASCRRPACCADVCTCRHTHRVTAAPADPRIATPPKGNGLVLYGPSRAIRFEF